MPDSRHAALVVLVAMVLVVLQAGTAGASGPVVLTPDDGPVDGDDDGPPSEPDSNPPAGESETPADESDTPRETTGAPPTAAGDGTPTSDTDGTPTDGADANNPGDDEEEDSDEEAEDNEDDDDESGSEQTGIQLPEDCENTEQLQNLVNSQGLASQLWPNAPDSIDTECASAVYIYLNSNCDTLACLGGVNLEEYIRDEICDIPSSGTFMPSRPSGTTPTGTPTATPTPNPSRQQALDACTDFQRTFINKLENSIRGGGLIPWWIAHPGKAFADLVSDIAHGVAGLIEQFSDIIYGIPAPGSTTDPGSWVSADGDWWNGIQVAYGLIAFVAMLVLIPPAMLAFDTNDPSRRRQALKRVLKSVVLIAFGWLVFPIGYHGASAVADALAPSGGAFVRTPGNFTRFASGIGVVLVAVLVLAEAGVVLLGLLVMFVQWALAYLLAGLWPLFWALRGQTNFYLRSMGSIGLALYFSLIVLKVLQAALARVLFSLPFNGRNFLLSLFVTGVGLLVIFVALPYTLFRKLLPRTHMVRNARRLNTDVSGDALGRGRGAISGRLSSLQSSVRSAFSTPSNATGGRRRSTASAGQLESGPSTQLPSGPATETSALPGNSDSDATTPAITGSKATDRPALPAGSSDGDESEPAFGSSQTETATEPTEQASETNNGGSWAWGGPMRESFRDETEDKQRNRRQRRRRSEEIDRETDDVSDTDE